ncbi:MAG: regulatory protein GemA [Gemmatimonadaceae bacterium]
MTATTRSSVRKRSLAAIHAGKRQLGWDDETYRGYLEQLTAKRSASELTDGELARVLDDMRQRGFARRPGAAAPTSKPATQLDKAWALWQELGELGELRSPGETGFHGYIERVAKRSRPEWCTPEQLSQVIEGLKAWLARARGRVVRGPVEE